MRDKLPTVNRLAARTSDSILVNALERWQLVVLQYSRRHLGGHLFLAFSIPFIKFFSGLLCIFFQFCIINLVVGVFLRCRISLYHLLFTLGPSIIRWVCFGLRVRGIGIGQTETQDESTDTDRFGYRCHGVAPCKALKLCRAKSTYPKCQLRSKI